MENIWITFNKTIWCPGFISEDLKVHEGIHIRQQKSFFGAVLWWVKYRISKEFRYKQELEAYRAQMKDLMKTYHSYENQHKIRWEFANILSGPIYGNMVKHSRAYFDLQ